jgi:hypothetical protein
MHRVDGAVDQDGRRGALVHRLQEEEGAEGNLTVVGGGRHGDGARPATSFNSDGYLLSMTRGLGQGETKFGAALDTVESG